MWALPAIEGVVGGSGRDGGRGGVPVVLDADRGERSVEAVRERALCLTLVALKGQGLSQHEVFAVADAWQIWDALTLEENDFVLDPAPDRQSLVNHAWRFEGAAVLAWALGAVRHLGFPDTPVDTGTVTEAVLRRIGPGPAPGVDPGAAPGDGPTPSPRALRPRAELLDAADIALRCGLLAASGAAPGLHPGVLHERRVAFDWLLPPVD